MNEKIVYSASSEFTKKYCDSSKQGLTISDIDNICYNYKTGKYCLIEHKSGLSNIDKLFGHYGQSQIYEKLNKVLSCDRDNFLGVYSIWSNTYNMVESTEFRINLQPATKQNVIDVHNCRPTRKRIDFTKLDIYNDIHKVVTLNKTDIKKDNSLDTFITNNNG